MRESEKLIKATKQKFILYSFLGIAAILFSSVISVSYHEKSVNLQKSLQSLSKLITEEYKLTNEIANLSKLFVDTEKNVSTIKDNLNDRVIKLNTLRKKIDKETENFPHKQLFRENIGLFQTKKENISKFTKTLKGLLAIPNNQSDVAKLHANSLSSQMRGDLGKSLIQIQSRFLDKLANENTKSNQLLIILILISIAQVLVVWVFVFKPLYTVITSQHERLLTTLIEARSANRSKTDFLANISHEIRTPMTAILGYAELLKNTNIEQEEKLTAINTINSNAIHLMEIIDEILDVSKMESGKFEVENRNVNLSKLLNEIYSLVNVKAKEKEIDLIFSNRGPIPKTVLVDPKRLKQILFNILGNAIKFTHEGYVEMSVHFVAKSNKLRFLIKDTGTGIAKDKIKKLFRPFEQVDSSVNREYGGTGLGLVLSRDLAKLMGGNVRIVKSTPGVGTSFEVEIAVGSISSEKLIPKLSTSIIQESNFEIDNVSIDGRSILVVDDAKENARLFELYLSKAGAKVEVANNGIDALKLCAKKYFDVVLLDLQMPVKDGFQVLKELQEKDYDKPVIALTAHAMQEEKDKTIEAGFNAHITKPVSPETLISEISKQIKLGSENYL